MTPLAICAGAIALLMWIATRFERHITVMAKRYETKIHLTPAQVRMMINSCDVLMEIYPDPQSDEHRNARDVKLQLERKLR